MTTVATIIKKKRIEIMGNVLSANVVTKYHPALICNKCMFMYFHYILIF